MLSRSLTCHTVHVAFHALVSCGRPEAVRRWHGALDAARRNTTPVSCAFSTANAPSFPDPLVDGQQRCEDGPEYSVTLIPQTVTLMVTLFRPWLARYTTPLLAAHEPAPHSGRRAPTQLCRTSCIEVQSPSSLTILPLRSGGIPVPVVCLVSKRSRQLRHALLEGVEFRQYVGLRLQQATIRRIDVALD